MFFTKLLLAMVTGGNRCPLTESNCQLMITNQLLYHLTKGAMIPYSVACNVSSATNSAISAITTSSITTGSV